MIQFIKTFLCFVSDWISRFEQISWMNESMTLFKTATCCNLLAFFYFTFRVSFHFLPIFHIIFNILNQLILQRVFLVIHKWLDTWIKLLFNESTTVYIVAAQYYINYIISEEEKITLSAPFNLKVRNECFKRMHMNYVLCLLWVLQFFHLSSSAEWTDGTKTRADQCFSLSFCYWEHRCTVNPRWSTLPRPSAPQYIWKNKL